MQHRRPRWRRFAARFSGLVAVLTALTVSLAACGGGSGSGGGGGAGGRVTLRIGDQSKTLELPLTLSGQSQGTPYGLSWNNFADGPHMNAAFSANRLDVGYMGDTPVLFANAARAGITVVAVSENTANSQTIFATAGSGIHTVADLKGKRVAITVGTSLHGYLLNQLQLAGLTQNDVTPVNVPVASLGASLASGQVDAVVYVRQFGARIAKQAPGSYQIQTRPLPQYSVLLAGKDALKDPAKRAAIEDFILRLSRASAWPKAHSAEWVQKYYVELLKQDPASATRYFASLPDARYTPVSDSFVQSQRVQAKLLGGAGVLPPTLNVDDEIDHAFNTELAAAFTKASLTT